MQRLASSFVNKVWCGTRNFLCEWPCTWAKQSRLSTFQKIIKRHRSFGLPCDLCTIDRQLTVRNFSTMRPLVLLALAMWQIVCSWNSNGHDCCKPRSFAHCVVRNGRLFILYLSWENVRFIGHFSALSCRKLYCPLYTPRAWWPQIFHDADQGLE